MKQHERIESRPDVMVGKPVIRGTRITVEQILRKLGAGMTPEQIMSDHPRITLEDIRAAEAFAADGQSRGSGLVSCIAVKFALDWNDHGQREKGSPN